MIYLLDTTIFSELMRRHPEVLDKVSALSRNDRVVISTITRGEVQFGINRLSNGRRKTALKQEFLHQLGLIACLPLTSEVGSVYGRIKVEALQKSLGLDENDLWIASHGFALNATVVTSDKDFFELHDLSVTNWRRSGAHP